MSLIGDRLRVSIEKLITDYRGSKLERLVLLGGGSYAIKYVNSRLASHYEHASPLNISSTSLQTWGTATYVTPLAYSLSSTLYGRVGIVSDYNPGGWRIFDATDARLRALYIRWVQQQAVYPQVLLTVHSTIGNQFLRNKFKEDFKIDCVLFRPDQSADLHTHARQDVWMAVTDWENGRIASGKSMRLANGRFTVLIDEDFISEDPNHLPVRAARRQIEEITARMAPNHCRPVSNARRDKTLPGTIINQYKNGGYLHIFIEP